MKIKPLVISTRFLIPFLTFSAEFCELKINDFKTVYFFQLIPLYKEEMDFVIKNGYEVFLEKLTERNIPDYIDLKRINLFIECKMMDGYPGTLGNWCPNCHTVIRNEKPGKCEITWRYNNAEISWLERNKRIPEILDVNNILL